jgi:hypothetical protein
VAACCASGVASPFRRGCDDASACRLVVPAGGGHRAVTSEADLAAALAPIDSPAEAVGLVALLHPEVQIPFGEDHATVLSEYAQLYRWQPYSAAPIAVEAETYSWGFAVRVPVVRFCGCRHGFVRVAYRVGRDGAVCRMDEPPLPIAYAHGDTCIQ